MNTAKASVHFVVEIDGTVTQHVATNRRANHAGQSSFNGRQGCNAFSLGIEIVNPGRMTRLSDTQALAWWGEEFAIGLFGIREAETPQHGKGLWMPYREEQLKAVVNLLTSLFAGIPTLKDITTHWYVSPGRKVDVNPLFPLDQVRAAVLGHDDPAEFTADAGSTPFEDGEAMVEIDVPGSTLNMRMWPSFNPNIIGVIPDGAIIPVLRTGTFEGRQWLRVLYGGREGWIVARYAAHIVHSN
ncbi:hypothetical protein MASR1M32_12290 [Rhodobacter sp.]